MMTDAGSSDYVYGHYWENGSFVKSKLVLAAYVTLDVPQHKQTWLSGARGVKTLLPDLSLGLGK